MFEPEGHHNPSHSRGRLDAHHNSEKSLLLEESPPFYGGVIQSLLRKTEEIQKIQRLKHSVYTFLLMELLVAFFIAMICLSGFFITEAWTMRKESAALHEAKLWFVSDTIMQHILLEEPLKQTLLKLPKKKPFQMVLNEKSTTVAITPDMKMTFSYSLFAKCEGEKKTKKNEKVRSYTLKIQFSYKDMAKQIHKEISYPLLMQYAASTTEEGNQNT